MNLNINLATRVYVNFKKLNLILILSFMVCIIWISLNAYMSMTNLEQINKFSAFISKKGKGVEGNVSDADYNKLLSRVKYVNVILYNRSYDWLSLLQNLEQLVPSGVSLKSLQPADKGESLTLSGVATGFSSVRKFMENLESSKSFKDIYLTNQSIVNDGKRKVINFTVTCKASLS